MSRESRPRSDRIPERTPLIPPQLVAVGETLRELRVLSDTDWEALPEAERPSPAERIEGLGWVVAASPGRKTKA